jgi:hypothetical protein
LDVESSSPGTRDAVCSIGAMYQSRLRWGLIVADTPVEPIEAHSASIARSRLQYVGGFVDGKRFASGDLIT